jgi:hypothetical protein
MHVFVTGGSGFVGGHLIEALVREGHRVRALVRSADSAAKVEGWGATPERGDLQDVVAAQMTGCDAVVHSAAYVEEWGTRAQFWDANVVGTTRVLEAAREAGVTRFVHVGTEAAVFDGHDLVDIDESQPYPQRQRFLYSETKAEAERRVLAANAPGFTTLSIRPRFVWGPRDTSVLPTLVRRASEGRFAWIDGGRKSTSTAHVANVVAALVCALTRGEGGRSYFIADDGVRTYREFLTALVATRGTSLGERNVSAFVARTAAAVVEAPWRWFGLRGTPPVTRFAAAMMSCTVTVRTDRARAELGWAPVIDVDRGLRELA